MSEDKIKELQVENDRLRAFCDENDRRRRIVEEENLELNKQIRFNIATRKWIETLHKISKIVDNKNISDDQIRMKIGHELWLGAATLTDFKSFGHKY